MNAFEEYVHDAVKAALAHIDTAELADVYALSFYLPQAEPREPLLQVGYNTRSRVQACTPAPGQSAGWPTASDAGEAAWNYAFWLQNELVWVPEPDSAGQAILEEVLKGEGLWYTDEEADDDEDGCLAIAEQIDTRFADMCAAAARALHASGAIEAMFGRAIPIIVHELEYHDRIVSLTELANPPALAGQFTAWVGSLYG
ncbi:hypothetical protein [Massilia sp. Mn16-1_5]|uniref:hypothetical protein n=1 Tax=Massilia sp. Mn16-1_5 TaxID=2079199 RepID=UPI00109E74A0|nr:hypothetical protein [Massilia sp. Mn16-1_5]THC44168.1 hypothetical protein C2862_09780 [Massilia sp. Mn16-1_5]